MTQHQAGDEGTQNDVQAEPGRQRQQREQQNDRPTQRGLGGGLLPCDQYAFGAPAPNQSWRKSEHDGESAHRDERKYRGETARRAQEDRDSHDWQELAGRTSGDDVLSEASREHVVIAQDR